MILTLEIMGPEAAKLGAGSRKEFGEAGGTIGRLPDNSWVLQDPYVSSRHAVIRFANGAFSIEDKSTNGTFINSPDNRLAKGQRHILKPGDVILIEPYEIRASIADGPSAADDPFAFANPFEEPEPAPARPRFKREVEPAGELLPVDDLDPLKLLGEEPSQPTPRGLRASDLSRSPLEEHYEPPAPEKPPSPGSPGDVIPQDYDPLGPDSVVVRPPRPSEPARPAASARKHSRRIPQAAVDPRPAAPAADAGGGATLADVLRGAGLSNVAVTPELARSFGEILQIVVSGVMEVLQARQGIREEFRMRVTTFKREDNNPLKFSANVEDALHNLLVKRMPGYLGPVDAFDDAFRDIRNHQIAMLAGMRAAFHAMLAEFEPDRLQEAFDRQLKKGGPQLVPSKMRYWELYRERVHDMVRDAEAAFRELFGEQFADAYEEQLERLKAQSRSGKR
jgi:type VI secretion system FHA domain protein